MARGGMFRICLYVGLLPVSVILLGLLAALLGPLLFGLLR